jgi:hypothetical protein
LRFADLDRDENLPDVGAFPEALPYAQARWVERIGDDAVVVVFFVCFTVLHLTPHRRTCWLCGDEQLG